MKHYGKLAFLGAMTLLCAQASAAPLSFSHSGVLRENGNLVTGERNFTAVIYDKDSGEEVGRLENKTLNVVDGVYVLTIDNIDEDLVAVSNGLELELQIGASAPLSPRFTINSVPFAISANHAKNADVAAVAKSVDCEGCIDMTRLDSNIQNTLDNALPNDTKYALSSTVGGDALKAVSADLKIATTDIANGDSIQIGSGTPINIVNAKHAASADSATKATQDGSGNTIASTYLTKMDAASTYQPKGTYLTEISDSSITSAKIKNETITTDDIADSAITSAKIENKTITMDDISSGVILPRAYAKIQAKRVGGKYSATLENDKNITKVAVDSNGLYTVTINANAKLSGTNYHVQITPYLETNQGGVGSCGIMEITNKSATEFTFQTGATSHTAPISVDEGLCYWGGYGDVQYMPLNIIIFQ